MISSHTQRRGTRCSPWAQIQKQVGGEISAERKAIYIKALMVWALFTFGGWCTIPQNFLPLFSHCVGFGFFLTITTRKTRWLGALAVGGLVFAVLISQTMPEDWISLSSQSVGYTTLIVFLALACVWRVVPQDMRADMIKGRDDMIKSGTALMEHLRNALRSEFNYPPQTPMVEEHEGSQLVTLPGTGRGGSGDEDLASIDGEQTLALLANLHKEGLCRVIKQMDAKLLESERQIDVMKKNFARMSQKLSARLDSEVEKRLVAEKTAADRQTNLQTLKTTMDASAAEHAAQLRVLTDELELLKTKYAQAVKSQEAVADKQQSLARDQRLAAALEAAETEKRLRLERERNLSQAVAARVRAETQLAEEKEAARRAAALVEHWTVVADDERRQRQQCNEQLRVQSEQCTRLAEALQVAEAKQRDLATQLVKVGENADAPAILFNDERLKACKIGQLSELESKTEAALARLRKHKEAALVKECDDLKQAHAVLKDKLLCRVCLHNELNVLLACGHFVLCGPCSARLASCPMCRQPILESQRVFVC